MIEGDQRFFNICFLPKLPENRDFFLLASLAIFHLKFCPKKWLILQFWEVKKMSKWGKAVGRALRRGCLLGCLFVCLFVLFFVFCFNFILA